MTEATARPTYHRSWVANGRTESADYSAFTINEMAMAAIKYRNVRPRDFDTFAGWEAACAEANDFANYCVGVTVDTVNGGDWCDPTISFRTLWAAWQRGLHS